MLFFFLLFLITGATTVASNFGAIRMRDKRARMRVAMASAFAFTGVDHLRTPGRYLPMLPRWIPYQHHIVLVSGLCELAGAVGLMTRRWRRPAAIMIALYLICETPANVKMAAEGLYVKDMPEARWFYQVRLLLIPAAVWWALYAASVARPGVSRKG